MDIEILYEDQDLLVINKPAGVVVNEAMTVQSETVQGWIWKRIDQDIVAKKDFWKELVPADFDDQYGTPEEIFESRQGIVHRLDKDTSGALILAKNPGSLVHLLAQFKKRTTAKKYTCLTHGKFNVKEDIVSAPLGRASHDRLKFGVKIDGKEAITRYEVKDFFPDLNIQKLKGKEENQSEAKRKELKMLKKSLKSYQGFSLVECWPKTGRTHQIRIHMAHVKHPLVGDVTYLGRKRKKLDPLWCPRHFLHASQIEFEHPRTGKKMKVEASLDTDLVQVLELVSA